MMGPFRPPYRWMPSTIWPNLKSCWFDLTCGVRNLWRWLPVIWFDADFDWDFTARILEIKLRRLADCMEEGQTMSGPRHAKKARTCAALLKRMMDDEYFRNAGYDPEIWDEKPAWRQTQIAKHSQQMANQDQRYFGMLLGKHLRSWWD